MCINIMLSATSCLTSDVKVSSSFQDGANLLVLVQMPNKDKKTPARKSAPVSFCAVVPHALLVILHEW